MNVASVPAGYWDLDLETGMLALCPQSRTMFGLSPDSTDCLTEDEWSSKFHPDDLAAVHDALTAGLTDGIPYAVRFRTIQEDATVRVVLGVGRPLEHANDNPRFAGWNFDVASIGEAAAEWIASNAGHSGAQNLVSALPSRVQLQCASSIRSRSDVLIARAESILRVRRAREHLFSRAIVGEPAFELLLHLYVQTEQRDLSLTRLALQTRVPYSSAIRWAKYLADKGLVICAESTSDRRAIVIQLTQSGRAAMDEFLSLE